MITVLIAFIILIYYKLWIGVGILIAWELIALCIIWPMTRKQQNAKNEYEKERAAAIMTMREEFLDVKGQVYVLASAIKVGKEAGQIEEGDSADVKEVYLNMNFKRHPKAF